MRAGLPFALLALGFALFYQLGVPLRATHGARVNGDEPFYLLTTISLIEDRDLDLRNDYQLERYRPFFDYPEGLWRQSVPTGDGRLLSPHNAGLPVLILPAYLAGGLDAVKAFLAVLGGLTIALAGVLAYRVTGALAASLCAAGFLGVSAPFFVYASQVYPEAPAALVVTGCACLLVGHRPGRVAAAVLAVGVAALLWLGVKYAPLAAILALATIFRTAGMKGALVMRKEQVVEGCGVGGLKHLEGGLSRRFRGRLETSLSARGETPTERLDAAISAASPWWWKRSRWTSPAALFLTLMAAALITYAWFHLATYGALTPYAVNLVYAGSSDLEIAGRQFQFWERLYRLAGLWFDGQFGLVRWAPVLLLALPGIPLLLAGRAQALWFLPALFGAQLLMAVFFSITMRGWWFPGRMMVAVLPVLVVPMAQALARLSMKAYVMAAALGTLTLTTTLALWAEARTGAVVLAVDPFALQSPLFQLTAPLFPVYTDYGPATWFLTALWLLAGAGLVAWGIGRPRARGAGFSPPKARTVPRTAAAGVPAFAAAPSARQGPERP